MLEHKRLQNQFDWIPLDKRNNGFPPRKPEIRVPVFWIACNDNELYFVNNSEETLDLVSVDTGNFQSGNERYTSYHDVLPNEAVKIEEYDGFYDLDFILQISLIIQSKIRGRIQILTGAKKGGIGETVILWNNNELGKRIRYEETI